MKEGNWKPHGLNSDFGMQFLCYVSVYSIKNKNKDYEFI